MTPDDYQQACLRTWHQGSVAFPLMLDDKAQIKDMVLASFHLEALKKRVFHGRLKPPSMVECDSAMANLVPIEPTTEPQVNAASHALIGLGGEWHEVAGATTREEKLSEAGDMLYYLTVWLHEQQISLSEVMNSNIAKLRARYPDSAPPTDTVGNVGQVLQKQGDRLAFVDFSERRSPPCTLETLRDSDPSPT